MDIISKIHIQILQFLYDNMYSSRHLIKIKLSDEQYYYLSKALSDRFSKYQREATECICNNKFFGFPLEVSKDCNNQSVFTLDMGTYGLYEVPIELPACNTSH